MVRKVIISGILGQDGSFMADFLLEKGDYEIHGLVRRVANENIEDRYSRVKHIKDKLILHSCDIQNYARVLEIIDQVKPSEFYHFGAQSFVSESFEDEHSTMHNNIDGTHNILSAIKLKCPKCKFYFAGSSEQFGKVSQTPQNEKTPFHPRSPYGISKVTGFELTRFYREAYKIFACSGICFNHESEKRGTEFVTRKITKGIANIKNGKINILILGNLDAKRDWGYAKDYVELMWKILQQRKPDDFVIATGQTHSIREFLYLAFQYAGLNYDIVDLSNMSIEDADAKVEELKKTKGNFVIQHPRFYRAAEVDILQGDSSKAKKVLGWEPKTKFEDLVKIMVKHDLK